MPKLHKAGGGSRAAVFAQAPGLDVTEALFEGVHDTIFCVKDADRRYVAVNRAFVLRARVANRQALLGRTAREVFPPRLAAGYEQQDDGVFRTGQAIRDRMEMVTNPDGSTGWYLTHKLPVRAGAAGRVIALVAVSADLRSPVDGDPRLAAVAGAIGRIQRDFGQPLRVQDLARSTGLSVSQFERRVAAVLHVSPRQLLTQTRVDAAARLLRETGLPLRRIAVDCGFYDQAMLCRQFRRATGLTPGQYRDVG